jgi:hypothetical protein
MVKKVNPRKKGSPGWKYFPIWGLRILDDVGIHCPIFGDATLVSRTFIERHASTDPATSALLAGRGLREILEKQGRKEVEPAPLDRLLEAPPDSFVAVCRANPDDAYQYAQSIRALLTGTAALTSGVAKGFTTDPRSLYWAAVPTVVQANPAGETSTTYTVNVSNLVRLTPLSVHHADLLNSWQKGTPVSGRWVLSSESGLGGVLVGSYGSLSSLRKRIRDSAVILARAMEAGDLSLSILLSVVALEALLKEGNSSFDDLRQLTHAVFEDRNGPERIDRMIENRHSFAHAGCISRSAKDHSVDIVAAWVVLEFAARISAQIKTTQGFLEHMRERALGLRTAESLRQKGWAELAKEVEDAVKQTGPRSEPA